VPLKLTVEELSKPFPVIVTGVPIGPLTGLNVIFDGVTVKFVVVVAEPAVVTTVIGPVVAATGTVAVIDVAELLTTVPAVPLKLTVAPGTRPVPVIVTFVPTGPLLGVKLLMVGVIVKLLALVAVPPGVVTVMTPVVALAGTVATI